MIQVRGAWMWAWVANIMFLWLMSIWGWLFDRELLLLGGAIWATWFLILEAIGWQVNKRSPGPELARTYSQIMQYFAHRDIGHNFWDTLTGWDLFVTGNLVIAGTAVGYIVGHVWHPGFGWMIGIVVAVWNYGHWHNRRKHG